jgi:hypothetical protein
MVLIVTSPQFILKHNRAGHFPRRMLFLDTETRPTVQGNEEIHHMKLAVTCFLDRKPGREKPTEIWKEWFSRDELMVYIQGLTSIHSPLFIFGHNIFFDLQASGFFNIFTSWGWILDFVYEEGLTYILSIHSGKRRIKALSTTNYFNANLKDLGKILGIEKFNVEFETVDNKTLMKYCRRDVEIIKAAMFLWFGFIKEHNLGKFSFTRASQAFAAFRHRFMSAKIYIHKEEKGLELERFAYMGGRVECFRMGKLPTSEYLSIDINSMYSFVMRNFLMPTRLTDIKENVSAEFLTRAMSRFCVIGECLIDTRLPIYAVRSGKKTIFPVGRFKAYLCSKGIQESISRGHFVRCIRASFYHSEMLFQDYVDYFYSLRLKYKKEGSAIFEHMVKILLNALYGKFAQWEIETKEREDFTRDGYSREEWIDLKTGERGVEYKLFNKVITQLGRRPGKSSLVAVAAHVTEYARIYLFHLMEKVGLKDVLYVDTDSIKLEAGKEIGVEDLLDDNLLGYLKVDSRFKTFEIRGAKNYITDGERTVKGVPKKAKDLGDDRFQYMSFVRQKTHMTRKFDDGYITIPVIKVVKPYYDKGVVLPDGKIEPFKLAEF